MKSRGLYFGIDFGTTNSSIAYIFDDPRQANTQKIHVKTVRMPVDEDGNANSDRMPTIASCHLKDKRHKSAIMGWEFFQQFGQSKRKTPLLRHGEDFFRSVKSDIGSFRVYPHAFTKDLDAPEKVAAAIIKHLLEIAQAELQGYNVWKSRLILTVPASLGAVAREHTLEAIRIAGIDPNLIELIDEPVAALLDFLNDGRAANLLEENESKNLLIFDYGGGTLDLSLVRARFDSSEKSGLHVENLAISPYRHLGGDQIDRAIMDKVVWPQIEESISKLPSEFQADVRQKINDTLTAIVARGLKEQICRRIAKKGLRQARNEEVISPLPSSIDIPGVSEKLPRQYKLSYNEFEKVMEPFLIIHENENKYYPLSLIAPIMETLDRAGIEPYQLDALILHGGSCRNPLIRTLLDELFANHETLFGNAQILETPDLDASVARGAALACYWRHCRKVEIIPPIIAEEIGILTLNNKPVQLLESGKRLPFPDEQGVYEIPTDLYVPKTGIRKMLVPVYTASPQPPLHIAVTIKVDVPAGAKKGDIVRIKLRVDRNKTLSWWFSVAGGEFYAAATLQNPWTAEIPTPEQQQLQEHRQRMRKSLLSSGLVTSQMLYDEANMLYQAGQLNDAELIITDLHRHYEITPDSANLMGLICSVRGEEQACIKWHKKATELAPHNAVYRGNLGYMLTDNGKDSEGEAEMRKALEINPDLRYLYTRLGDLYRKRGNEEGALREYKEAIRLTEKDLSRYPENIPYLRNIESLYRKIADYDNANEIRRQIHICEQNQRLGGDHTTRIAGPDSGIFYE